MTSSRAFRALLVLFVVSVGAVIGIGFFALGSSDDELRGSHAEPPRSVESFRLSDTSGQETGFAAAPNGITLTFFGFTHCPDVCPTTLSDVRTALQSVDSNADRVKVAMVTIDPARDSAEVLNQYVGQFFDAGSGIGLRTDDQQRLREVARGFGAAYDVKPAAIPGGEPEVEHSAWLYAVDDTGHIQAQWAFGTPAADIAHDLRILLR
jgi:protein SCO1/2